MRIDQILRPLSSCPLQSYLGTGLHTLGLLGWILQQTGRADVYVSTFSTSEEFLSGFNNLRKKGLIANATLLADVKASRKTIRIKPLMQSCFDKVCLGLNHSKVVLVQNYQWTVTVISSQNQTYGGRAETTLVTTSQDIFLQQYSGFRQLLENNSIILNGLHSATTHGD